MPILPSAFCATSRRLIRSVAVLLAFALAIAAPSGRAHATWNKIQQFNGYISASYFFSVDSGFIGFNSIPLGKISRTTDGGATWTDCNIPVLGGTDVPFITEIWFSDRDTGWATVAGVMKVNDARLWKTVDGGLNWKVVTNSVFNWPSGVRTTPNSLIVTEGGGVGVHVSTDRGLTWAATFNKYNGGVDFLDTHYGIATNVTPPGGGWANGANGFLWTTDGGRQWATCGIDFKHEAWTVYAMKNSSMFMAAPEDTVTHAGFFPGSPIYRSKPSSYGANWDKITTLPFRTNGCIKGISNGLNNVIFVQNSGTWGTATAGLYRSRDSGVTWTSIGGPNEGTDVAFSVLRCGDVIYAFDDNGGLWKTTDGGDGVVIPECVCLNKDSLKVLVSSVCDSTHNKYWIHNPNVGEIVVEDIRIIDTLKRPSKTTAVHIDSLPDPYSTILVGDSLAFTMGWRPRAMMDSTASDSALVRIILYAGYLERVHVNPYDTIYRKVSLSGLGLAPQFLLSAKSLKLDSLTSCTADTMISIVNTGCDSLMISKAALSALPTGWTVTDTAGNPIKLPIRLGIGSMTKFALHVASKSGVAISDSLKVTMHYQGKDSTFTVQLRVTAKLVPPFLTPTSFAFDSIATCVHSDTAIVLGNSGCAGDTLYVRAADLSNKDWTLYDKSGKAVTLPIAIGSGSTDTLILRFAPSKLGATSGSLRLHYHYLNFDSSNLITFTGGGAMSGSLAYGTQFDLGQVSVCAPLGHDTVITFHNTSCDSAFVSQLAIVGPFKLIDSTKIPAWIASGKTLTLRVRFLPQKKGATTATGLLKIATNNGQTVATDTLRFTGIGLPGTSTFETQPALAAVTFATRSTCGDLDSVLYTVFNRGCDTLHVTAITFDAGISSDYSGHADRALPATVAPNDSLHITLAMAALAPGTHAGNAHVTFTAADGSTHDTTIGLTVVITQGSGTSTLTTTTPAALDFGAVAPCATRDTTIMLTAKGCGPITIIGRKINGAGYSISDDVSKDTTLQPGGSLAIHVHYDASGGAGAGTVTVTSGPPQNQVETFSLSSSSKPVDSVHFAISFSKMPVTSNESFNVYLKPDRALAPKGLRTISGVLVYHRDSYQEPKQVTGPMGITATPVVAVSGKDIRLTFVFTSASDITLDPTQPVLTAPLVAMDADSVAVMIAVDSLRLNGDDPSFATCTLASDDLAKSTTFTASCGDSTLILQLRGRPLVTNEHLRPNPITALDHYIGWLDIQAAAAGVAVVEVTDALGRTVSTQSVALSSGETTSVKVDLSQQPAGTYFYSLRFVSEAGRAQKNGMLQLVK